MTDAQKENILLNLAQVREHLALYRVGDSMHPDAEVNWIHTQGEMAKVLEVGRANHLTGNEMEDAMLASMYSDAVKFASPAPVGAKANFFTHHLDGALAAKESLTNQGFPPERIEGIVQAIRAHQLAPPRFMGEMYYGAVNRGIDAALKDRQINAVEAQHLRNVLENMSEIGADGKTRIKAIADVNNAPKFMGADGQMQVAFTPEEQKVLSYSGTDTWNVPYDPKADPNFKQMSKAEQAQALERQKISQTLIDADGIDNYSTSGGASKLFAISGPGTPYHDGQMWDVIDPSRSSFKDALPVMSPEAQKLAQASLASRDAFTNPQSGELKKELDQWIISQGRDPSKPIPYYNTDLKYPTSETLAPGERNYPGLNDQEMKDYLFAKEIREHAVELLRRDHRVEGDLPGRFFPATDDSQLNASRNNFGARSPEKLTIPGTNPENIKPGEHFTSPDKTISAYRNPDDGSLSVTDFSNNTFRRFDSENRLIESTAANTNREFHYNSNGQLNDVSTVNVATGEKTILSRTADGQGWVESYTDSSGKLTRVTRGESELLVDADGTVRRYGKVNGNEVLDRYNPDGSKDLVYPTGRIDYLRANYAKEKQALESSLSRDLADNPNRLARAQELIKQFEANAEDPERNLSTNDRALLYKQINRLLTDSTATAIPLVDRVNLAEQVLDHSAHPWHVDQGSNSTCNVTTLEHRNYWRNPDKNAQLIADVALDGKYTFASGQVVNMRDMSGELKPDFEAKRNLARQAEGAPLQKGSLKADGERDYSSQILETTMVNNRWNNSTETIDMQGRKLTQADTRMRYGANGEALGVVEHGHFHALYDQNGDLVSSYKPGEQYYDVDKKPLPAIPPERIVYDQNGVTEGFVDKTENLQQIYDARGNRLTKSPALYNEGVKVFDKDGHLYMAHTRPGDFHYEKVPTGPKGDGERVIVDLGGRKIELRDKHGDVQSSPSISAAELAGINKNVTGKTEPSFIIGSDHTVGGFEINVNSTDEMLAALRKMEAEHNLPAVMMVNTSKPPFDAPITYNKDGKFDGWHVVNVQGIKTVKDPVTGEERQMIRFTNQWGSKRDFLKDGVDAKTMFESMQRTPDKPPAPTPPPTPPSDNSSFWKRVKKWFT